MEPLGSPFSTFKLNGTQYRGNLAIKKTLLQESNHCLLIHTQYIRFFEPRGRYIIGILLPYEGWFMDGPNKSSGKSINAQRLSQAHIRAPFDWNQVIFTQLKATMWNLWSIKRFHGTLKFMHHTINLSFIRSYFHR